MAGGEEGHRQWGSSPQRKKRGQEPSRGEGPQASYRCLQFFEKRAYAQPHGGLSPLYSVCHHSSGGNMRFLSGKGPTLTFSRHFPKNRRTGHGLSASACQRDSGPVGPEYQGMPKNRFPFSSVIRAHSSAEIPLISASFSQTWRTSVESLRCPRQGTGAM